MLTKSHEDILGGLTYKGFKKEGEIHNESDKKETLISRSCDERRMITNLLGPIMVDNKKSVGGRQYRRFMYTRVMNYGW